MAHDGASPTKPAEQNRPTEIARGGSVCGNASAPQHPTAMPQPRHEPPVMPQPQHPRRSLGMRPPQCPPDAPGQGGIESTPGEGRGSGCAALSPQAKTRVAERCRRLPVMHGRKAFPPPFHPICLRVSASKDSGRGALLPVGSP